MASLISVHVDSIEVPEYRQRSTPLDKEKILEMAESFKRGRQIHPIVLRRNGSDEKWILVAGFRRWSTRKLFVPNLTLRCGQLTIESNHIAATDWGSLSDIEREEIELDENVIRVDLVPVEKAAAIGKLHALRTAQAEAKGTFYSNFELAEESRVAPGQPTAQRVSEAATLLQLSKHLDDPQAAKIKTISEARSFLQKKQQLSRNAELRRAFEATSEKGTNNRIIHGSCYDLSVLSQLPQGQFDVACLDPPYGIGADSFGEQGGLTPGNAGHQYADSKSVFDEVCARVPSILEQLLKPQAHCYIFCDPRGYEQLKHSMEFSGFEVWHVPLIWSKGRGIIPRPKFGPRRSYEMILYAIRGGKEVEAVANDVLTHPAVQTPRHGAEKPVPLLIDLLMRSVRPGSLVLDLFAGSGSIFPAATATHSIAWGVEREQSSYDLAVTRLTERYEGPAAGSSSTIDQPSGGKARSPLEELV